MKLLQHFKELTVRPKNAQELKGLILQLAIQGKLTANWREENPDIVPASDLLKRIQKEKEQLVKEKKIKKEKPLPKINKEKIIINLPKKWETVRLGEIGDWGAGATPLRSNSSFYGGEINWFKSGELNNSIMDYGSKEKITELALEKTSVRLNNPGDVLIAMYGATIGKTGILQVTGTTNQAVCACTPFSCITSLFLHLLLKGLKDTFINQGEGGAQPNISRVKIRNQFFGLPPLEEQKEIVRVVETLFKEVELLEQLTVKRIGLKEDFVTSALHQLATNNANQEWTFLQDHFKSFFNETTNIKKLRETVLQLAVQGKLTADWREQQTLSGVEVEDANQLLKRIQKEKAQLLKEKKIKKEKALPPITKDEIPYELPEGWVWCRLGDILLSTDAGKSPSCEKRPVEKDEWGVLTTTSIQKGYFLQSENKVLPSSFEINHSMDVKEGDVLITRAGPLNRTGIVCRVKDLSYNLILSDKTVRLKHFADNVNGDFLVVILNSSIIRELLVAMMSGMASSQVNISQGNIKLSMIPLPPLKEQAAIVKQVNRLMALCDSIEEHIENSHTQIEQLMQSCLREVFEGKMEEIEI